MLIDIIQSAIHERKELLIKVQSGAETGEAIEVFIQPYIHGFDVLQFEFVWGFLTHHRIFYKIYTDSILCAEAIEIPFTVSEGTVYGHTAGEELLDVLEGVEIQTTEAYACAE